MRLNSINFKNIKVIKQLYQMSNLKANIPFELIVFKFL